MPIEKLNEGLKAFQEALQEDTRAAGFVDVCVISFDAKVNIAVPFTAAEEVEIPELHAFSANERSTNQAILAGLEQIEKLKQEYNSNDVDYAKPDIFLLSKGLPTDNIYEDTVFQKFSILTIRDLPDIVAVCHEEGIEGSLKPYVQFVKGMQLKTITELTNIFHGLLI